MTSVWGHPSEVGCRPHAWTSVATCDKCGTIRCEAVNQSGRCTNARGHQEGTFHRFPDLWSMAVTADKARKPRRKEPPPDLMPA